MPFKDKEKALQYQAKYRIKHKQKYKKYFKKYREKHKEKIQEYKKDYYNKEENKKNKSIKDKIYRNKNRNKINKYTAKKKKQNINFKLRHILRNRIGNAVKNKHKRGSAVRDLGCSIDKFILWIEMNWQHGMSWENYGVKGWHLDHIKPLSKFNLENREEFLKACHFTNLQPLWAEDNLRKSDTYVEN